MRFCVFGSSSQKTPKKYLDVAYSLGQEIAKSGNDAVTGGGQFGCMMGAQKGCIEAGGEVIYVVHQKFIDGGSVDVNAKGVKEVVCAKGDDLTERKRLLVDYSDAIMICPGGVGTFDEFWDIVSHKSLSMKGLDKKPIVVLNCDGFYDGFIEQLRRSGQDGLLYLDTEKFFMVTPSPAEAVKMATKYIQDIEANGVEDLGRSRTKSGDNKLKAGSNKSPAATKGSGALDMLSLTIGITIGAVLTVVASRHAKLLA
jgi:hypothetical protein